MIASRTASEIWSASLSGCPSVTDSLVKSLRYAISLCSFGPGGHVLLLFRRQRVDLDVERRQFETRDFFVDPLGHRVDLLLQLAVVRGEVGRRKRLIGERHVHDRRRVTLRRGESDHPP